MSSPGGAHIPAKREGDISDSFASLAGLGETPLPDRFRELKLRLSAGNQDDIIAGWDRLLAVLKKENEIIASRGPSVIPSIQFDNLAYELKQRKVELKKRGVAVVRGVIPEDEARSYKYLLEEYVRQNPQTRGFPQDNPQVFELYWSASQLRARAHPNLIAVQKALMTQLWHVSSPEAPISLSTPLAYADRLRIRQPGDAMFALGPHQDGGSVERWEPEGYGRGHVYDVVLRGDWESYDPYDATGRVEAVGDLYNGLGACSMFRMFQGWLAMAHCGPHQGTLLVSPMPHESTAYELLRPFFRPRREARETSREEFLAPDNWVFTAGDEMTSELQGATPGHGQEFPQGGHPHLELDRTMVHIPEVRPGDFVIWHCDVIHAVDKIHSGTADSSVLYIPVCPTTEACARYVARQRASFLEGTPAPDFPGGKGESEHVGRPTEEYAKKYLSAAGRQCMGLETLVAAADETPGGRWAVERANEILGL